ncbi:helix-turn-helix domain-containing protein [Pseudonocardia halophobica]|uniref:Sigma 54 type regulator n=1 Tax=Pseudonocardia halophobica TaxID=29401 RepID=A0A9W6KY76_9PSEU|nr:sigma 54 type regulator [Pseudonocardia halophobica]
MSVLRPEIAQSWHRIESCGLDPAACIDVGAVVEPDPGTRLRRAAGPVLTALEGHLRGSRFALVLADRETRLVDIRFGSPELEPVLQSVGVVPGQLFTEQVSGTNSVATVAELRRGIAVVGAEHYLESLKRFACYGVPIRDPLTGRHAGVLDITCLTADASPLLRPFLLGAAQQIADGMLAEARGSHRRVLAAFEAARLRAAGPLVAFGPDLVLTNDAAADLLQPVDHAALQALRHGRPGAVHTEVELASGRRMVARVEPVGGGGFLVELERPERPSVVRVAVPVPDRDWHAELRPRILRYRAEQANVLVLGEPGTGRTTVATQLAGAGPVAVLAGALVTVAETHVPLAEATGGGTLLVEDAHLLAPAVAAHLGHEADRRGVRLVLTAGLDGLPPGETAAFGARCPVRLELPTVRSRRDRIPALAGALLRERAGGAVRFTTGALRTLAAHDWPGNLRELATVVGYVAGRRSAGDLTEADLPPGYREGPREPVPGALWQAERDAIVRCLESCGGNKVHAARRLGISRTTLYRRIRELHIDPEALRERPA